MQLAAKCQTNKLINSWREQTLPVISNCPFGGWSGVKPAAGAARSPGPGDGREQGLGGTRASRVHMGTTQHCQPQPAAVGPPSPCPDTLKAAVIGMELNAKLSLHPSISLPSPGTTHRVQRPPTRPKTLLSSSASFAN